MNKAELISAVAEKLGTSKKDADKAVNAVFDTITETVAKNEKVQLVGFGTFEVKTRAGHKGHNPRTNAEIIIPESKIPQFKAGKALKDAANK
ncbi:MAG: HU family DNA-binding protein [Oscillospiraceae bacterium]|nr:HU family DNA-binding protein [Oscillospiraceae bacterium]